MTSRGSVYVHKGQVWVLSLRVLIPPEDGKRPAKETEMESQLNETGIKKADPKPREGSIGLSEK